MNFVECRVPDREMMERQNDAAIEDLEAKVGQLKDITRRGGALLGSPGGDGYIRLLDRLRSTPSTGTLQFCGLYYTDFNLSYSIP